MNVKNRVRFGYPLVITCPDVDSVHVEPAATTADITWYGDASAVAVKIYEDVLPVTISGDHVATVSGLQPEHTYTLSVYAVCDGNDTSYFAENVTFTTLPTCLPVAQLTAADSTITDNSAVISWQNPGEAASFIVMMGDSVLNDAYTETSYTLSDLVADTTYTITVYAVCSEDDTAHPVTMTFATKPSCLPVATLTLSDTTAHSIVISWESEASAFAMVVNNEYITDENIASPYTLTGLESETWYSVAVYAICGNDTTPYAATARFMTPPSCYPVTNLTVVDSTNTGNSVVLTWVSDAPNFAVMVNNVFITDENIASPYTLTGLNPETQYTVKVYAVCDDNDTAKTAPQVSFTTPEICPEGMVCIGEGTTTNSYLPTYTYYNYSLTQQIYTAEEIGAAANILSVDIYNGGSTKTRNIDVYMVNTTKTAFADNYDWEPVTEANLVYSGEVTFTAGQWNTITFATPFAYDGQSNVILAVDDNTGSWSSGFAGRVFNTTSEQALRVYSDNTNYDPTDPSNYSGTTMDVKNRVRFAVTPLFTNFDVTVSVNPENAGTVTSEPETLTELAAGTEVTLTATAAEGYRFVNWTIDNEEVDNQLTYTFAVEANVDVVANFEELLPGTIYDTINASSADPTMGSVTANVALGQPVAEGTEVTLTAVPATCHTFVAWMENNELVS
ncbi:fibronectin type III domain-containing protein, partial [Candidatus Ruminimicrobium bovinum]|uniref:fibronectin type III domain-containing protein n=1 Tax=Candidatus Ruminimicrobium bovinum TaxID=3242779 RepID=UPI0039B8F643